MRKKLIIIICSAVIILLAAVLGFSIVLSVNEVRVSYTLYSDEARENAAEVQEKLNEYIGKNFLFADEKDFAAVYDDYEHFKVVSVEKKFPDRIEIVVEEYMESYAVYVPGESGAGKYYMLDRNGFVVCTKSENENNLDGGANVLLEGVTFTSLEAGSYAQGDSWEEILAVLRGMDEALGGIRSSIKSITFQSPTTDAKDDFIRFETSEGVELYIFHPAHLAEEKVQKVATLYRELSDLNTLFGKIEAVDSAVEETAIVCSYTSRDNTVTVYR